MIFIADSFAYTENNKVWSYQNFKNRKDFLDFFLINLCEILNSCPDITQLILISRSFYSISNEDLAKYIKTGDYGYNLIWAPAEQRKKFPSLLLNTKIFTAEDLHVVPAKIQRYAGHLKRDQLKTSKLVKFINEDKVVTCSIYLSPAFIQIIKNIPQLEIYKRSFVNPDKSKFSWEKVENSIVYNGFISHYSTMVTAYPELKLDPELKYSISNIVECFKDNRNIEPVNVRSFYNAGLKVMNGSIMKINLVSSEEYSGDYLIDNFIADLEKKYGEFDTYNSLNGSQTFGKKKNGIVVFNAHKLEQPKIKEIISEIRSKKYPNKFYILHSFGTLKYLNDPTVKTIILPNYENMKTVVHRIVAYMSKKIFASEEVRAIIELLAGGGGFVQRMFEDITSLEAIEAELIELTSSKHFRYVDFRHQDFWYDFDDYIFKKYISGEEIVSSTKKVIPVQSPLQKGEKTPSTEKKNKKGEVPDNTNAVDEEQNLTSIHFIHKSGSDKWEINYSSSKESIEVNYKNNLGIKYLAYLALYCYPESKMKIRSDYLLKAIHEWDDKKIPNRNKRKKACNPTKKKKKLSEQLDAADIKSAILYSFIHRSSTLRKSNRNWKEIRHQEKLEKLQLRKEYDTTKKPLTGKGFIEFFYYKPNSGYIIDKVIDEDKVIPPPPLK